MKKILLCVMILIVSITSFSQQNDTSTINTRKYYLHKSTKQLIVGTLLLGIGVTTITLIRNATISFENPLLPLFGALCVPVSIPFFFASWSNKRKASHATTYLKMERVPILQQTGIIFHSYPSISVKINL
jgi:cytochrome bd-type quinol oxidase subunit 2